MDHFNFPVSLKRMFIPLLFLFSSCATLMNEPTTKVHVFTTAPSIIIVDTDTLKTKRNRVKLEVERSAEPLEIIAITDSLTKKVRIPSKNSLAYKSNLLYNAGIGFLTENDHPKRYTYHRRVYLVSSDTLSKFYKYGVENNKNLFRLNISLPYLNIFQLQPEVESTKKSLGFLGVSIGLDYFYSSTNFINISTYTVTDFPFFIPAPIDRIDPYETLSSFFTILSHNHKFKRLTIGYGLSYNKNVWYLRSGFRFDIEEPAVEFKKKISYAIGAVVPIYYELGSTFHLGLIYRPTFYRPNISPAFKYEHLISIDLAWKFRLNG